MTLQDRTPWMFSIVILMLIISESSAKWMMPRVQNVPATKLIQNAEKLIKLYPNDAQLYYVLGRLHSLEYAKSGQTMSANNYIAFVKGEGSKATNYLVPYTGPIYISNPLEKEVYKNPSDKEQKIKHLKEAIKNYEKATKLNTDYAFGFLGLAWCLKEDEQIDKAIDAYRKAFEMFCDEKKQPRYYFGTRQSAAKEAGEALISLLFKRMSFRNILEIMQIKRKIKYLQKHGDGYITPIVFPTEPLSENDFLKSVNTLKHQPFVRFDISGLGTPEYVRWLPKNWAFLVWDPQNAKTITSGKQLFGSVTWWIFWNNGYEPLSLLDDNQDGYLKEKELEGVAVWRDENQDGTSQPQEVQPLSSYKITAIKTQHDGKVEGIVFSKTGLLLSDGTVLPTLDWMPEVRDEMLPSLSLLKQ